jgi:hypothetical protein
MWTLIGYLIGVVILFLVLSVSITFGIKWGVSSYLSSEFNVFSVPVKISNPELLTIQRQVQQAGKLTPDQFSYMKQQYGDDITKWKL